MTGASGTPASASHLRTVVAVVVLAGLAAALGVACGSSATRESRPSLPTAGSPQDDGSGQLARASSEAGLRGLLHRGLGQDGARDYSFEYGGAQYGGTQYGGAQYGGTQYGGTLYGNYRFDWNTYPWSTQPHRAHERGYLPGPVRQGGSIEGRVVWPKPPRAAPMLATDAKGCPDQVANHTLRVDDAGHVQGAVVYLERIQRGRYGVMEPTLRLHSMQIGGVLRQERCQFVPHVQVISPVGALVRLVTGDSTPRTWTGTNPEGRALFEALLSRIAPRQVTMARADFVRVTDNQTPASAWLVVAGHPYYTITDDSGQFALHDVPPGAYTLVVWHEPVARLTTNGRIALTEATVSRTRVKVRAQGHTNIMVRLPAAR